MITSLISFLNYVTNIYHLFKLSALNNILLRNRPKQLRRFITSLKFENINLITYPSERIFIKATMALSSASGIPGLPSSSLFIFDDTSGAGQVCTSK